MDTGLTTPTEEPQHAERWRAVALFVLTSCCLLACLLFLHTLLFSVVGAITLAVVTQPLSAWMRRRMSKSWAAAAMVLLIGLAVFVPLFFLIKHLVVQAIALVRFVTSGGMDDFLQQLAVRHTTLGGLLQNGVDQLAPRASGKAVAGWMAPKLALGLQATVKGIADGVLLLFFYFFLVRDEARAVPALEAVLPLRNDEAFDFVRKLREVIQAIFAGRMLIAMLQGTTAGLAYWVLGVPGALLWGFVTFLCCLIPAFGAFIAWVPIVLYLGLAQSWTKALILAVWCGAVVSTMDNFLYPMLVGKKTDLHTAVIFIAIFGGLAVFGVSGFVVGPVLVAATMLLLQVWKQRLTETSAT